MSARALGLGALAAVLVATPALAGPTRSSPLAVAADGTVFVVNPDSDSVGRLVFGASPALQEAPVGRYPRTLALAGSWVFTADQGSDTVSRLDQADLGNLRHAPLDAGCSPYGVAATPAGDRVLVTCQGPSTVVILDSGLSPLGVVRLDWPNARAIAITADGAKAYVTHYLTEEPGTDAHVSVVDLGQQSVMRVFAIPADTTTCETQNSGQGVINLLSAIAIVPAGPLAGQVWVGGTQENVVNKGMFKRFPGFTGEPGGTLFPLATFTPFPGPPQSGRKPRRNRKPIPAPIDSSANRDKYKASFHDITRFGIYKLDGVDGHVIGKIDIDEANNATDVEFSADGTVAYVVDLMFNSYHLFNTLKGQDGDVTTLFAGPSAFGPGGGDSTRRCIPDALNSIVPERGFRIAPQAEIRTIDGYDPFDASFASVDTGVEFDAPTFMSTGQSRMRAVPDGIGTAPIGVRLSPDGHTVYVANYLSRNVVPVGGAEPLDPAGKPANLRCAAAASQPCATDDDCPAGRGFCNHPGGASCTRDADCGANGPCIRAADCVAMVLGPPLSSITGGIDHDPLPAALLDGKILFNTAARDASPPNNIGLDRAAPLFNDADTPVNAKVPGSVVSTSHDASYVTCSTCHADFGGQDGRTWDFSQFGASLRNSMDLRGRAAFAPGHCSNDPAVACFFDAACNPGSTTGNFCRMNPDLIPPNVPAADRDRYFNPMLTNHWNGDRDEVEDFEHTYRSLMGAGDCDGIEDVQDPPLSDPIQRGRGCLGALIQRSRFTSTDPVDVNDDLGAPNRNLRGHVDPSKVVGIRLSHMADFVYSLTDFPKNPNPPDEVAERGRRLFNDPQTRCAECHSGGPGPGRQLFTDKRPKKVGLEDFDPNQPAGADRNNPFLRHDVGTANMFDRTDPFQVAKVTGFQNSRIGIPASRGVLGDYVTPVLNDAWNTAPYLHDGSAPTLLDVVRPCDTSLDDCNQLGRGRNLDDKHGATSFLTPQELNDLAAFQKTLTLATVVGNGDRVVVAGRLALTRATLAFGRRGRGSFAVAGELSAAPGPIDLAAGIVLTLGTPAGERMAFRSWQLATRGGGRAFIGRAADGAGTIVLRLRDVGDGRLRFKAVGRRVDLAALATRTYDLTVALQISGTNFVKNRNLTGTRRIFRLPKKGAS